MKKYVYIATFALVSATACATTPQSNEKAESSSAAIRAAEEVGAQHEAQAALHLQLAKEQFEHARKLKDPDDKDRADRLLLRAQADAELALALARTEKEKSEASAAINQVEKLQSSSAK